MKVQLDKSEIVQNNRVFFFLLIFATSLLSFGIFYEPLPNLWQGLVNIYLSPDGLISDYFVVAGIGAAFVNSGVMMLMVITMLKLLGLPFHGASIAAAFIVAGFALFGKNLMTVWPIMSGVFIYSKVKKEPFSNYVFTAIFGTAMSPMVSEVMFYPTIHRIDGVILGILIGIFVGFILPAIASFTSRIHQGYNLYNVGFASGFIGTMIVSFLRQFGFEVMLHNKWSTGNNSLFIPFLLITFAVMAVYAFILDRHSFVDGIKVSRHSGRAVSDFIVRDGVPATLMNMAMTGIMSTLFVIIVGSDLNGPTIGGILTIVGFSAFGKNVRNISHVFAGAIIGSLLGLWDFRNPVIILGALFGTGIAPIGGQFGFTWGVIATIVHMSIVQNLGPLHGGLNLYNNGFSGGFVAILLVPFIESMQRGFHHDDTGK